MQIFYIYFRRRGGGRGLFFLFFVKHKITVLILIFYVIRKISKYIKNYAWV